MDVDKSDLALMGGIGLLAGGALLLLTQKKTTTVDANPNAPHIDWISPAVISGSGLPVGSSLTVSGRNFTNPTTVTTLVIQPLSPLRPPIPQVQVITPVSSTILLIRSEYFTPSAGAQQTLITVQLSTNLGSSNIVTVEVLTP